jgi:hypothetical protein
MSTSSWTNLLDLIYPIDSVYISVNDVYTPAELFGGTWARLEKAACLRSCVSDEEGESAGSNFRLYGSDTFTLSAEQLPPHKHNTVDTARLVNVSSGTTATTPSNAVSSSYTNEQGGFLTGSTLFTESGYKVAAQATITRVPRYVECCVYRRTA